MQPGLVVTALVALLAAAPAQNSTKKIRPAPTAPAERAGSAVPWRDSLATALGEAKKTGKPVFWYVPSVAGTPMDRTPEIDRYLRGGPFSWPTTIELLRTHFVPVAEIPRGEVQKRYELVRQRFVEPGYLVLDGDGKVLLAVAQITTLHPEWFETPLRDLVHQASEGFPGNPALREAWDAYRRSEPDQAIARCDAVLASGPGAAVAAEADWLAGAALCRSGRRPAAIARWRQLAELLPDEPLAWKAALEAEGHGPFGHGFEDYLPLPAAACPTRPSDGTRAPGVYGEPELWLRGASFLLAMDDGDGVVRDSIYDFGGTDSLPNVHAAVTCLVGEALLAAADRQRQGQLQFPPPTLARLEAMLLAIRTNVEQAHWLALSDRDEILWARAYALRFLLAWQARRPSDAAAIRPVLQRSVGALLALQPETGVWFHEYGNPFAIATALQALHGAQQAGVEVDQKAIDRGLAALLQDRTAEGAFTYSHTKNGKPRASLPAAAGRMPLCELGLFLFERSDQARLQHAVETGFRHHDLLAAVRKYDDHADQHGYGGFFFWFDMLARSEATMRLSAGEKRTALVAQQRALVLELPEIDGAFVDSHELGRAYGTAMALLCLDTLALPR